MPTPEEFAAYIKSVDAKDFLVVDITKIDPEAAKEISTIVRRPILLLEDLNAIDSLTLEEMEHLQESIEELIKWKRTIPKAKPNRQPTPNEQSPAKSEGMLARVLRKSRNALHKL